MQQGVTQALVLSGGEIPVAEALGMVSVLRLDDVAPLPEAGIATNVAKLEQRPEQVKRVLRATVRALQFLKTDREGSLPIFMQFLSMSREQAEKRALNLTEDVPTARVADFRPLYAMLAEQQVTPAADRAR